MRFLVHFHLRAAGLRDECTKATRNLMLPLAMCSGCSLLLVTCYGCPLPFGPFTSCDVLRMFFTSCDMLWMSLYLLTCCA